MAAAASERRSSGRRIAIIVVIVFCIVPTLAGWQWRRSKQEKRWLSAQLTVRDLKLAISQVLAYNDQIMGNDSEDLVAAFQRARVSPERIIERCDDGLADDPNVAWLYRLRAAMHREKGNLDLARQDLASAERLEEELRKAGKEPSYDVKINVRLTPPPQIDADEQQAIDVVTRLGGKVFRNRQLAGEPLVRVSLGDKEVSEDDLKQLRTLSKIKAFSLLGTKITDEMLSVIVSVFPSLETLKLGDVGETDLSGLSDLQSLKSLDLAAADLDVTRFRGLGAVKSLIALDLSFNAQFADEGIEDVAAITGLQRLDLSDTSVSDVGLAKLSPLVELKSLDVADTKASAQGVAELQKTLPDCKIHFK